VDEGAGPAHAADDATTISRAQSRDKCIAAF
jgi:hypothetical protein